MKPLINILIRTSNRPEYFHRCIDSIQEQFYCNHRIIVSADNEETAEYVRMRGIEPVMVPELKRDANNTFPWNLHLNSLKAQVRKGWIMILDDDDFFSDEFSLQCIADYLMEEDSILVYKLMFPDGRTVPDDEYWTKTPFTRKHMGMPCFCFHSNYKNIVHFDGKRAGDFRFINSLLNHVNKVYWLDHVLIRLSNHGLNGAKKDLSDEKS